MHYGPPKEIFGWAMAHPKCRVAPSMLEEASFKNIGIGMRDYIHALYSRRPLAIKVLFFHVITLLWA
jgi:hypothetical protein